MKKLIAFLKRIFGIQDGGSGPSEGQSGGGPAAPAFDYGSLSWSFGGFNGSKASEVKGASISCLKVDVQKGRMDYKWVSGGCEALGASSRTDYDNTLACIFYWDAGSGRWVGGKFDYVSTSRTSRPLENCDGYKGWKWAPFAASGKYAFVIVDVSGKRRTNVIFS